ncbi:molybdopterin synthase subunit MoaE [Parasphingorhabdus marina DSM 22363]|uniref:Molybdopterin synthase catalytic subunit n=1 Tax=Parasphingorhabdus marina DSM 22363 TaxID=1123272 RepID=A0A1N6F3F6_9SPHN|nr:molybdenum cofactor biosynthesis protein MoaE [Parasphingorhabdus marina]SIN89736.1 molybdopterin synthase subunit MoaE [Parasphingorhabdus marina DSM 22363]
MITISVSQKDFDSGAEIRKIADLGGGAVASFTGQVRGDADLVALELEHYPAMTEQALRTIADDAAEKWALHGITIIHRVGRLQVNDQIVLVCTGSDHRQAAISACSFIMDKLKTVAPFWKKEIWKDGSETWVEERQSDLDAAAEWKGRA